MINSPTEARDLLARNETFGDDLRSLLAQYTKLRASFPDLSDDEMAHRMVLNRRQTKRMRQLLEK